MFKRARDIPLFSPPTISKTGHLIGHSPRILSVLSSAHTMLYPLLLNIFAYTSISMNISNINLTFNRAAWGMALLMKILFQKVMILVSKFHKINVQFNQYKFEMNIVDVTVVFHVDFLIKLNVFLIYTQKQNTLLYHVCWWFSNISV